MLTKHPLKILWLDTETTGLKAEENDVIQIAGIFDIDTIAGEEFNMYVQPYNWENISEEALKVNGHDIAQLRTYEPGASIHRRLVDILGRFLDKYDRTDKAFIGGQNPSFDRDFLKAFWIKNGDPYFGSWFDYHTIDLCSWSLAFHIKRIVDLRDPNTGRISVRLSNVAQAFGLEQEEPHDALSDIRLTRRIFYECMIDRIIVP